MDKFTTWTAVAVPFDQPNIDTNALCPTRFNKVEKGPKYAQVLFHDLRFNPDGSEKPDFILNQPPYRKAGIIVAERNFGCGSSRESAVYAVATFGIRAIIAPSFGDIFFNNCLKNSVVPVVLDADTCAAIRAQLHARIGAEITVDLQRQVAIDTGGPRARLSHPPLAPPMPARRARRYFADIRVHGGDRAVRDRLSAGVFVDRSGRRSLTT